MIVLDTHVLIWWLSSPSQLSAKARRAVNGAIADTGVQVSAISILEIATLARRGRLRFSVPAEKWLADLRLLPELRLAPVTADIAQLAGSFGDEVPGDPADRIIVATSIAASASLVTADKRLRSYKGLRSVW